MIIKIDTVKSIQNTALTHSSPHPSPVYSWKAPRDLWGSTSSVINKMEIPIAHFVKKYYPNKMQMFRITNLVQTKYWTKVVLQIPSSYFISKLVSLRYLHSTKKWVLCTCFIKYSNPNKLQIIRFLRWIHSKMGTSVRHNVLHRISSRVLSTNINSVAPNIYCLGSCARVQKNSTTTETRGKILNVTWFWPNPRSEMYNITIKFRFKCTDHFQWMWSVVFKWEVIIHLCQKSASEV